MEFVDDTPYPADNGVAKAPGDRLLVANSELFDPNGPPFFVDGIERPSSAVRTIPHVEFTSVTQGSLNLGQYTRSVESRGLEGLLVVLAVIAP